jgi:ribosome-associated protein
MTKLASELRAAVDAAHSKKAKNIVVLDLRKLGAFTDYFVICTGLSHPQIAAISDEVELQLEKLGNTRVRREGQSRTSEWVLLDYGFFVVHIFSERARLFYDIERLWRAATRLDVPEAAGTGA